MTLPTSSPRSAVRIVAGAVLALAVAACGCGRPPDDSWLKFLGFRSGDSTLSVISGDLSDGKTDSADALFENASVTLGTASSTTGTGIMVTKARVDYRMRGFSPPSAEYPVNLYLGPSAVADKTVTVTEGTLSAFPLATASLKQWLIATRAFDNANATPQVQLTAVVTFFAESDQGTKLEVSGSIAIVLSNGGGANAPNTVRISATKPTASSAANGEFTVTRTGPTSYDLVIFYTSGGTAEAGTDYLALAGSVTIGAGKTTETIAVTPIAGYASGATVVVTIAEDAGYNNGGQSTATVTLK